MTLCSSVFLYDGGGGSPRYGVAISFGIHLELTSECRTDRISRNAKKLQILSIFANISWICATETCDLACLVASLWRHGGPRDDLGTSGGHHKRHFAVQAWIFTNFWWIQGLRFECFLDALDQNKNIR